MTTHLYLNGFNKKANKLAAAIHDVTGVSITDDQSRTILAAIFFDSDSSDDAGIEVGKSKQPVVVNPSPETKPYFVVHYGSDMHLLKGVNLLKSNIAGNESWVSPADFSLYAYELAKSDNESELHFECLPQILGQHWSEESVLTLAKSIGMLKTYFSVFVSVSSAILVRINGRPSFTEIHNDYLSLIEQAYEVGRDPFDVVIWEPETEDGDTYLFTFGDMAKAVMVNDGEVWRIPSKWGEAEVAVIR